MKANPSLKGKALEDALQKPALGSGRQVAAVFPQVLTMMSEKLDWTQKLGDAFLAQQKEVMATVQALRAKAVDARQRSRIPRSRRSQRKRRTDTTIIKIEPADPAGRLRADVQPDGRLRRVALPGVSAVLLVPAGYATAYGGALLGFTAGVIIGGALWGNCNWGGGDVNINVNRYNNFNRTNISNGNWNHNVESPRRGAVPRQGRRAAVRARTVRRCRFAGGVSRPRRLRAPVDPARRGVVARPCGPRSGQPRCRQSRRRGRRS